ncbi:hypothetical protein M3Y94_00005500 [Aphelenchoides besseyi]|nr:hypothetical protein M3Y94_00005500 [Aphelenchoides besseyi]
MVVCDHKNYIGQSWRFPDEDSWPKFKQTKISPTIRFEFRPSVKFFLRIENVDGRDGLPIQQVSIGCDGVANDFDCYLWGEQEGSTYGGPPSGKYALGSKDEPTKVDKRESLISKPTFLRLNCEIVYNKGCPYCAVELVAREREQMTEAIANYDDEHKRLVDQLAKVTRERDEWKAKATAGNSQTTGLQQLEAKIDLKIATLASENKKKMADLDDQMNVIIETLTKLTQ